jgi:SNF2 family DNA or RNA helicase
LPSSKPRKKRTKFQRLLDKLKEYQFECVMFGTSRAAAGFFLAPGLGKTLVTLVIFRFLKKLGLVDELLVMAKRRIVYNVWRQEIKKWKLPFKTVILHGSHKEERLWEPADVRLINYDGLYWLKKQKAWFRRGKRVMLVCDESSKVRNTNTQRFRSLKSILPHFVRRYILTGSPTPKGLINLFGQIYVLDLGEAFGPYITAFRNNYFYPSGYLGYQWKLQPGGAKRIYKKIKPLVLRYGTDELDMPPLTFVDRWVKLPPNVRRDYDELEKEYIVEYREGAIVAANAAVASGKLRQMANGGIYYSGQTYLDEDRKKKQKWRTVHDEKCAELVELLEELNGEPALIAYDFGHDKLRIQAYFKKHAPQFKDAPFIGGKMKDAEVTRLLKQWDKGELPVMFGHPASVAHGLNLQGKGGIVIFFALPWGLEEYEQFIQRVWRQGQKKRVIVYRILAKDTVDEDIVSTINFNDHVQTSFLEAMGRRVGETITVKRSKKHGKWE